ncbi:hypothetical protein OE88DRAFT_1807981 [Heliocybe sulcata]|uniref:Uncharacterized protein n=1 Tax=Heliocybe sulcata TaxID=5364 RepID=A0A5C3N127_9AGAM|nr:hypothetical protein OE88DRAFT_1807981 [Heliocybe sulcata]
MSLHVLSDLSGNAGCNVEMDIGLDDAWESIPRCFLASSQDTLQSLSLESENLIIGYFRPGIDSDSLAELHFPRLKNLMLGRMAFDDEDKGRPVQKFIVSHKQNLERLVLKRCSMVCLSCNTAPEARWKDTFTRWAKELCCLREVEVFDHDYQLWEGEYDFCFEDPEWADLEDGEIAAFLAEDAAALQMLKNATKQRKS